MDPQEIMKKKLQEEPARKELEEKKQVVTRRRIERDYEKEKSLEEIENSISNFDPNDMYTDAALETLKRQMTVKNREFITSTRADLTFIHPDFKQCFNLKKSETICIGAKSGHGKSIAMCNVAASFYEQDKKVLILSNEMDAYDLYRWIGCILAGLSTSTLDNPNSPVDEVRDAVTKMNEVINSRRIIIVDDLRAASSELILKFMYELKPENRPDILLIDYLTNISSLRSTSTDGNYWALEDFLSKLRKVANNQFPIVIAAQMKEDGAGEVLRRFYMGSGIFRFSTVVIEVKANHEASTTDFIFHKSRNGAHGKLTMGFMNGRYVSANNGGFISFARARRAKQQDKIIEALSASVPDTTQD